MMPQHELITLQLTIAEAEDSAQDGQAADDYMALLRGLNRAQQFLLDREPQP